MSTNARIQPFSIRAPLTLNILLLAAMAVVTILVHGYHLGSEDAEIYIPAIKKAADPQLFPYDSVFFMHHAQLSFFPNLIGNFARFTRLPIDWAIFLSHALSVFLLLVAARRLLSVCFQSPHAQWCGVALLSLVLSVPVAGTSLLIMDPYLTARSFSTPATLFAIGCFAEKRYTRAALWLLFTALIHPQMAVYGAVFLACLWLSPQRAHSALAPGFAPLAVLPFSFDFSPASGVYRQILTSRSYFSVANWTWYEWIGVFAPLLLLCWFQRVNPAFTRSPFPRLCRALVLLGLVFTGLGVTLSASDHFDSLLRLQPMRSFHLLYVIFFLFLGALVGEYLLKDICWRWCAFFLPLTVLMLTVAAQSYPSSSHIEWPGARDRSAWISAFLWVRGHTPKDAVFALDPNYMSLPGNDQHGFRAIAERSALADNLKDSGAVSLFPQLAALWKQQVDAQVGWRKFKLGNFRNLDSGYGVDWFILQRSQVVKGLTCPYQNDTVRVCRLTPNPTPAFLHIAQTHLP